MNNVILYLDSKDAAANGLECSADYAYCVLVRTPAHSIDELLSRDTSDTGINAVLFRYIQDAESVSFILVDILYYRFIMSLVMLLSLRDKPEAMSLLIRVLDPVYDSMAREDVTTLLETPDINSIEKVLELIYEGIKAQDEDFSVMFCSKILEIRNELLGPSSEDIVASFYTDTSRVIPFSLSAGKREIEKIVGDDTFITTCNEGSAIFSHLQAMTPIIGDLEVFKSLNHFCTMVCSVFSEIFVKGEQNDLLDDTYKSIWTFIIKTRSSCFVPQKAYEKARRLLL